jgi:FecR-like protein
MGEVTAAMKHKSATIALIGLAMLGVPAFGAEAARPGTVNYVEGAANLDRQPLNAKDVGRATLEAGQELRTGAGKAEVLLTPGVFLRLDSNSTVKMISPDLTLTQVELEKGRGAVEVDELHNQNDLQVIDAGVTTRLDKTGYYEFDANQPEAMVFKGMAKSEVADGKWREIKSHHELALTAGENGQPLAREKPADFDPNANDELYNWSSLRSQYLAEANNEMASQYYGAGYDPGWFWDPYAFGYTYMGMEPFASPFGWGYYPFGWGGFMGGYYGGGGWYGGRGGHGPYRFGGYHGGSRGIYGGGFHGSGGFHGGGGGGFHGGGGHR